MSYLVLPPRIPDFDKAVLSLWFRVPQSTIDAKKAAGDAYNSESGAPPLFQYIIPLITFGPPITAWLAESVYENVAHAVNYVPFPGTEPVIMVPTSLNITGETPIEPAYIGIDARDAASPRLVINIQTRGRAELTNIGNVLASIDVYSPSGTPWPPPGYPGSDVPGSGWSSGGIYHDTAITDNSISYNIVPEAFYVKPALTVEPDHWHHLLLSFDISSSLSTFAAEPSEDGSSHATTAEGTLSWAQLWYALDDVNHAGSADDLGPNFVDGGTDPNAILTDNAWRVANNITGLVGNLWDSPATCNFAAGPIASADTELGIPAATAYVDSVYPVELAELQFFTGITIDTAIESNRRAFIDPHGKPVPPIQSIDSDGNLVAPPAERLLGKPDILLHGNSNWIKGINTGPEFVPDPDSPDPDHPRMIPDPAAALTPTGKIVSYSPDPSLHGAQDVPAPPARSQIAIRQDA